MSVLSSLGYGPFFSSQLSEDDLATLEPGRVVFGQGARARVRFEDAEVSAAVPGRLRAGGAGPVVGDFVLASRAGREAVVERVLERRTRLSRGAAGRATAEQILAANVDVALVVQGLDGDFNPRRLERTLAAVHAGGAEPVVLLAKADLVDDVAPFVEAARASAPGVEVIAVSALRGDGLGDVRALLAPGRTAVLAGSSGVGKSTLANALLGAQLRETKPVLPDGRGRHTTSDRRLFPLEGGGALVDGPGLRELKLWDAAGIGRAFEDVESLAAGCRYRDCRHAGEPGCAVVAAVEEGRLAPERLESLHKLEREIELQEMRKDGSARAEERRRWRSIHKELRHFTKWRRS